MKHIHFLIVALKKNSFIKSIITAAIPRESRLKAYRFMNLYQKKPSVRLYFKNSTTSIEPESGYVHGSIQGLIPVFYWDGTPNFGDLVGPYLISKITGRPVLNVRNLRYPGIMTVGSIIQMLDRENVIIWGSGLIYKLTDAHMSTLKNYNPTVLSVRGQETAKQLLAAGINVPDKSVYGDPALILPLFYTPSLSPSKKIGVCPHYMHKSHFLEQHPIQRDFKIIDVQKDMEAVVDSICSSSVCISTSLHGLIIAQAYGVPWIWLEIFDNNLGGDDFKFNDFFSTLNRSQVSHIRIRMRDVKNIDFNKMSEKANLPDKLYDEELILESLKTYLSQQALVS